MATPSWLAASPGYRADAGAVTQFLGAHTSQWVYTGTLQTQQATGSAVYESLASLYYSQLITTGAAQTTIGRVALQVSAVGGSPLTATISPLAVALYAASSGIPTGPVLAAAQVAEPYVYSQPFWCSVPLYAAGLSPSSTYCLVAYGPSTGSAYYAWQCSTQPTGAATSTDGVTWNVAPYGLMWQVYDATASGQIQSIVADDGARIATLSWSGAALTGITEYTIMQGGGTLVSTRTLTYASNGLLKGVG